MTDTIFDQVDADAARDYNPDPARPTPREIRNENRPGDFKIAPTDDDVAAIKEVVANRRRLPLDFTDEPF